MRIFSFFHCNAKQPRFLGWVGWWGGGGKRTGGPLVAWVLGRTSKTKHLGVVIVVVVGGGGDGGGFCFVFVFVGGGGGGEALG